MTTTVYRLYLPRDAWAWVQRTPNMGRYLVHECPQPLPQTPDITYRDPSGKLLGKETEQ